MGTKHKELLLKDLCKTCANHWTDFPLPLESAIPHCSVVDEKEGFKNMDEVVP